MAAWPSTKAVMSVPRIGWNDSWNCLLQSVTQLRIPVQQLGGVFWGQCLQRGFELCIEEGFDWILTIDFDSMFTVKQLVALLDEFNEHQEIDALAPVQMRRGVECPLLQRAGMKDGDSEIIDDFVTPLKVTAAHFGLTLLRTKALKKVGKPWFLPVADDNGSWGPGRVDDDQFFWSEWAAAGNTVFVTPKVSIGHLEVMVSHFDAEYQPRHSYVPDWRKLHGLQ